MKKLVSIILLALFVALPMSAKRRTTDKGNPEITFEQSSFDFGTIKEADGAVEHSFTFTNTGTAPLAIITVSAECGCTKPEFPKKPVAPGKSGIITLRFMPKGYKGHFMKNATVRTNIKGAGSKVTITIEGDVIPEK